MIFRCFWPITDDKLGMGELIKQATPDVPMLLARAHAAIGPNSSGRWSIAPSASIPGSGRTTDYVLLFEAPARRVPTRAYRKAS